MAEPVKIKCDICGKEMVWKGPGKPKLYHLVCLMKATEKSRGYVKTRGRVV